MQEKTSKPIPEEDDEPKLKKIPRGVNPETLRKFINDAANSRPYHNLAVNMEWLNWALDYLILAEKEEFSIDESYLRIPGPGPLSPEPRVMFWDLDLGRESP